MVEKLKIFSHMAGGEFSGSDFITHLLNCGIRHYISCVETPRQNYIVERRHRPIVELGLVMLNEASMSHNYRVEAFNIVMFIISSSSLIMKAPY